MNALHCFEVQFNSIRMVRHKILGMGTGNCLAGPNFANIYDPTHHKTILACVVTCKTICCTADEINVFSCLPVAPTANMLNQVVAIDCTTKNTNWVQYIDVLIQDSFSDCRVFAIASITALVNGKQFDTTNE